MIYLASRYSDPDPLIMKTRFLLVEQITAQKIEEGYFIYSPIVHCHEMALKYALPKDFEFWKAYNIDMIRRADEFWFLNEFHVFDSVGVKAEIKFAGEAGIEIKAVDREGKVTAWQKS